MQFPAEHYLLIGRNIWVNQVGRQGICMAVYGGWALVQDDRRCLHAVPLQEVATSEAAPSP